jgi:hypothetical protein
MLVVEEDHLLDQLVVESQVEQVVEVMEQLIQEQQEVLQEQLTLEEVEEQTLHLMEMDLTAVRESLS